jgi:hypothetical protein
MNARLRVSGAIMAQKIDKAEKKEMKARNKAAKLDKASKSLYKNKTFVNKH